MIRRFFSAAAYRQNRRPENTEREVPITINPFAASMRSRHACVILLGTVPPKKNDIWHQRSAACCTGGHGKTVHKSPGQISVAIGPQCDRLDVGESVVRFQPVLNRGAGEGRIAIEATDLIQSAMEIDDVLGAGGLMQSVHVLCNDPMQ